jgi:hypothetical protein
MAKQKSAEGEAKGPFARQDPASPEPFWRMDGVKDPASRAGEAPLKRAVGH